MVQVSYHHPYTFPWTTQTLLKVAMISSSIAFTVALFWSFRYLLSKYHQELISLVRGMHFSDNRESCSGNISINNVAIVSPKSLKTRKIFLNIEIALCEISHLILQMKSFSRVVFIVNHVKISPHNSNSFIRPQIENKVRLNRAKELSHNPSIMNFPLRQSLGTLMCGNTPINMTPQFFSFDK